jgi:Domain of unknown function (DUF4386)
VNAMTTEETKYQVGGICAILTGIFTVIGAVLYFLLPDAQKLGVPGNVILPSFAQNPTFLQLENLALGLVGIFGLGLVPALSQFARTEENGWLRWTATLATVGYAVSAVGSIVILSRLPIIANAYVQGEPSTQAALAAVWRTTLDPFGLWGYGFIGLWILLTSLNFLRSSNKGIPNTLAYLGILSGIVHWFVPIAFVLHLPAIFLAVAGIGLIAISAWYVWVGLVLRRGG